MILEELLLTEPPVLPEYIHPKKEPPSMMASPRLLDSNTHLRLNEPLKLSGKRSAFPEATSKVQRRSKLHRQKLAEDLNRTKRRRVSSRLSSISNDHQ